MTDAVLELVLIETAIEKLGARGISEREAQQLLANLYVTTRNPSQGGGAERQLLIGYTDGGRMLTLVIEQTPEPSSWLVITGWTTAAHERKMLD
ncbi:MAG TPA: hypothetical protein VNY83_02545 [Solirubrobacterales bacterium]|nr:hypothetical protein [Solirubrobacterales bacterium]